ncbi:MAG: DUF6504 family protein [Propionibacteriaceae bacterium]|nr:DUF6504 family protein [Propionibacteriaceae bacterium]
MFCLIGPQVTHKFFGVAARDEGVYSLNIELVFELKREVAVRRYHEPIQVKVGQGPMQFIWRGRLLVVREIQGQWSRSLPWWDQSEFSGDLLAEEEVWRVEAGTGSQRGIYELAHQTGTANWVLAAVCD